MRYVPGIKDFGTKRSSYGRRIIKRIEVNVETGLMNFLKPLNLLKREGTRGVGKLWGVFWIAENFGRTKCKNVKVVANKKSIVMENRFQSIL